MNNKIGIIGIGVVGEAVKSGLESLGHEVLVHDLRLDTELEDLLETEACFICVPTPSKTTYECDTSTVESVITQLSSLEYQGIIAVKSTVPPETTIGFQEKYDNNMKPYV